MGGKCVNCNSKQAATIRAGHRVCPYCQLPKFVKIEGLKKEQFIRARDKYKSRHWADDVDGGCQLSDEIAEGEINMLFHDRVKAPGVHEASGVVFT